MNVKDNKSFFITLALAVVILLGGVFMILKFRSQYSEVGSQLEQKLVRLKALEKKNPYPSQENIQVMQENAKVIAKLKEDVISELKKEQLEGAQIGRAQFQQILEKTIWGLEKLAKKNSVEVPRGFAFGFQRQVEGALPSDEFIPRLVLQLRIVNKICRALYDSKVAEVISITREEIETPVEVVPSYGNSSSSSASNKKKGEEVKEEEVNWDDLYTRNSFRCVFRGKESAVLDAIEKLTTQQPFVIVSNVKLQNENTELKRTIVGLVDDAKSRTTSDAADAAAEDADAFAILDDPDETADPAAPVVQQLKDLSWQERLLAGLELVRAEVTVGVYNFKATAEEDAISDDKSNDKKEGSE